MEGRTALEVPVEISGRRAGNAVALHHDTTKATRELGWTPRLPDLDTVVSTARAIHRRAMNI